MVTACNKSSDSKQKNDQQEVAAEATTVPEGNEQNDQEQQEADVPVEIPAPSLEEQKEYYLKETKPAIEAINEDYDFAWETLWTYTFNGLSDGSISFTDGIKKLETAEKRYDRLYKKAQEIPTEGLDKENTNKVGSYVVEIQDAISFRLEAINEAIKMLKDEDLSQSNIEGIYTIVSDANSFMMQAVAYFTDIEKTLNDK